LDGEFSKGILEIISGVSGTFPGVGTATSLGIDAGLIATDVLEALAKWIYKQFNINYIW